MVGAARASGRGRTTSRAVLAVLVLVVALDVFALGGLKALGISLLPHQEQPAAVGPPAAAPIRTVSLTQTPAARFIAASLIRNPTPRWLATGSVSWAASTAFDQACSANTASAGPAIAGQRVFVVDGHAVTVAVRAYGAGQGMPAMRALLSRVRDCAQGGANVGAAPAPNLGVAAIAGWAQPAGSPDRVSTLLWRRGDVVASVSVAGRPNSLPALVLDLDPVLLTRLTPVCANVHPVIIDSVRSPYGDRNSFQGWQVPQPVQVTSLGTPPPPPGVFPVPLDHTSTPLPSISIPVEPAPPVWPLALPTMVLSPLAPTPPGPEPTATTIPVPTQDPVGPGCGWAFTGQIAPPFDAASAQVAGAAAIEGAQAQLVATQQAWDQAVLEFWSSQGSYDSTATSYVAYAAAVRTVAKAWGKITTDRDDYARALADYTTALASQADFLARRAAAQAVYDAAVATCAGLITPTPTPTPGEPAPTCPPVTPPILSEPTPTVPPSPTPPAVAGPDGLPLVTATLTP